ncbi:hypothetical protein O6H91_09G066500 [Diphasiastrum complanatum]|nr:hypothetical protein O6H91_09G066500 [Diphasiastrum complanatum]
MSLAWLACYGMHSTCHNESYYEASEIVVKITPSGSFVKDWSQKPPTAPANMESPRASDTRHWIIPAENGSPFSASSPRLTRCHAIRRELPNDWDLSFKPQQEGSSVCN